MTSLTQVFTDLVRAETRLYTGLDALIQAEHGVTLGQVQFLTLIRDVPGCRVYDIVADVGITVGAVSKGVDRLESAGWVRRTANPDDRRSSLLALTPGGATKLDDALPTLQAGLEETFDRLLTTRQVDQLAASLAALRARLEERRSGTA